MHVTCPKRVQQWQTEHTQLQIFASVVSAHWITCPPCSCWAATNSSLALCLRQRQVHSTTEFRKTPEAAGGFCVAIITRAANICLCRASPSDSVPQYQALLYGDVINRQRAACAREPELASSLQIEGGHGTLAYTMPCFLVNS